ncbi:MAG: hypothetical protein RJA70_1367, partial [Pseudomonadota bacterium]
LEEMLDCHGADLNSWPVAARRAAEELLERDPGARELYRAARIVDNTLSEAEALEPSGELLRRVAEIPTREPDAPGRGALPGWFSWWRAAAFGCLCASTGAAAGWITPPEAGQAPSLTEQTPEQGAAEVEQLDALALSSEYLVSSADWVDLL